MCRSQSNTRLYQACYVGAQQESAKPIRLAVFLFFYFYFHFHFLQKYIFVFEIYMNILRPSRCRAAGTWPPGSRAAETYLQKKLTKNYTEDPGGPAARQRGGQPSRPPGTGAAGPLHQCRGLAAVRVILCYEDTKQEQPANKSTRIVSRQQVSFFFERYSWQQVVDDQSVIQR